MNLIESILNAGGGSVVKQIAGSLGLGEGDTRSAMQSLAPALSRGIARNTRQPGGVEALIGALTSGNHQRYIEEPSRLTQNEAIEDGNRILGHLLGSKDVSRNVAGHAAQQTGLDSGILKKMLPMMAAAAMGSLGKAQLSGGAGESAGMAGMLETFLDADRDGAVVDDLLTMAKKFF